MQKKNADQCTAKELMIIAAAREIKNGDVVFVGLGIPMAAVYFAKKTHAPKAKICNEAGVIDTVPIDNPISIGDPRLSYGCAKSCGNFYCLSLLQKGCVDVGIIGGAEIDKYGNVNSTVIGDYRKPKVRLPGSGGANDFASNAKRMVIIMSHEKRRFPEKVSYITSPGFIDGPDGRQRAGLKGGGPSRVVTDMAVLGFHPESKMMQLESVHPGVSVEEVKANTNFELLIPKEVHVTAPPTPNQLRILRTKILQNSL
jgi:glutaconate CoA-transferase subunit B